MKSKTLLLIFLLALASCSKQKAEPSLQDVYELVHSHAPTTTLDLASCFYHAKAGYFDPKYNNDAYAPAGSLSRFKNYKLPIFSIAWFRYEK
jgi:hypothetical protein